jgi:hypothetical protein
MQALSTISTVLIGLVGLANLLPVVGVLSAARLQSLYGVVLEDANLVVLMRHRAVLFGIVGGLLLTSAFHAPLRPVGVAVGLTSMLSFILIAWLVGDINPELRRVVVVDWVASAALVAAVLLDRCAASGGLAA